jgi:exodeoxyribonuclease V gamma subunit
MQLTIAQAETMVEHARPLPAPPDTLLGRLQADVRENRAPPGAPLPGQPDARPALAPDDDSVQIHACHGRARQVEVLRDGVLHLLDADPTLEPRDVIVMCPDVESFAPLINATFGAGDVLNDDELDPLPADVRPPDLRVRLADRSLRQTNPLLGVVSQLIELARRRVTVSEVLDLADQEPVRSRFSFDDDDLTRLRTWVSDSGVRWGLDAAHRAQFQLERLDAGTWHAGLDRILLGVALSEDGQELFGGVLPLDDVDSGAIDLAGRLAEFVGRIRVALDALSEMQTLEDWSSAISAAADALTAASERDAWQRVELDRVLAEVVQESAIAGRDASLTVSLPDMRALLDRRLQGRPTRANFRTGHLSICTLYPMRSVPHRVVCLMGLDDGAFPRKAPRDGDDLLLGDPCVGDREPRSEDRQMLLDALLAAGDHLVITYTGNDERTNIPVPPAVPVGELLDAIDATVSAQSGTPRDAVVIRHPLQPFDPRNFTAGALVLQRPWSYDRTAADGARALCGNRQPREPFLCEPLPAQQGEVVELERLVRFVERPVRAFLHQRLGITVFEADDEIADALSLELDALQESRVGQRLLEARLRGIEGEASVEAELARGTLPPGELARPIIARAQPRVDDIASKATQLLGSDSAASVGVHLVLDDGRVLAGTVPGVRGTTIGVSAYSRVNARQRLAMWVRLLALTAARPEHAYETVIVGRVRWGVDNATVTVARLPALAPDQADRAQLARQHLATLVDIYDRGMREPLPLPALTAAAYARAVYRDRNPQPAARAFWQSNYKIDKEDKESEHTRVFGGVITLEALLAIQPRADEHGADWFDAEPSRLGRYARRLWSPVLAHERLMDT